MATKKGATRGTVVVATVRSSAPSTAHQLPMLSSIGVRFASQPRATVAKKASSIQPASLPVPSQQAPDLVAGRWSLVASLRSVAGRWLAWSLVAPTPRRRGGRFPHADGQAHSARFGGPAHCST